jgi:4-amino-4-deoxy-L-arabinose transferase-like glycosyltransferase
VRRALSRAALPWAAGVAFALVAVLTYRHYGTTWDEGVQATYGELVLRYYASLGRDQAANTFLDLRFYGPLFEAVAALLVRAFPATGWDVRHLATALSGALAVVAAGRLGALVDRRLALAAAVGLLTLPRFYGHAFDDSKDIPFACAFAWSLVACVRLASARRPTASAILRCGFLVGTALAIRVGGMLLFGFVGLALLLRPRRSWPSVLGPAIVIGVLAWTVMVAAWPWTHAAPLSRPLEALAVTARFSAVYPVLFDGAVVPSSELPATYVPRYLAITVPVPHLLLALVALVAPLSRRWRADVLVRLALVVPVLLAVAIKPNVYDGVRHFAFVLPCVAVLAARGALVLLDRFPRRVPAAGLLAVLPLLPLVVDLVRLHPYQSTFFNALVGGLRGAAGRYETDYWAASYREAMGFVNEQARAGGGVRVLVAANAYSIVCAQPWADPSVSLVSVFQAGIPGPLPNGYDFYVATTRYGLDRSFPDAPVVHTVGRDGAVFTVIRGRR